MLLLRLFSYSEKNYLYISFCEKNIFAFVREMKKYLFIFQQKTKLQEQLFEEKRNYSSSLQISLSDLNNKGLEDGTNREYISYMEKIYITFVTLGFK